MHYRAHTAQKSFSPSLSLVAGPLETISRCDLSREWGEEEEEEKRGRRRKKRRRRRKWTLGRHSIINAGHGLIIISRLICFNL